MLNSIYPNKTFHMFDKLLEQPGCLCKIETSNPEKIYQRLDRYQDYTGKAFYFWKEGQGLYRADIPNIFAPNTASFEKALHHISMSIHFGMYLFIDIGNALQSPLAVKLLEKIIRNQSENDRLLIFAGTEIELPDKLSNYVTLIKHKVVNDKTNAEQLMAS